MPGKPAYQHIADDLRGQIAKGDLAVGKAVSSMAQLMAKYDVSSTVARKAIDQLRIEGLVVGRPGKGVYVKATPSEIAAESVTLESVDDRLEAVEAEVRELRSRVASLESGQ
jgi:DNA-binding GntR family transcriptional regulator